MGTGRPLGLAPKKSLARQAGWAALADVAPASGRSGDDAAAVLAGSTVVVAAPTLLVAAEQAGSSVAGAAPLAEGPVSPVVMVMTAPSQDQPGVATVVPESVVRSAPPEAPVEVDVTASCREQPDTAMVVSEGAMQSMPSEA